MYTIAIDCDEVLSETLDALLSYHHHQRKGTPIYRDDISNYHLHEIKELHMNFQEEVTFERSFLLDPVSLETIQPVSGAQERTRQRKEAGHHLFIVTGRSDPLKDFTYRRLDKHFPDIFEDVIFANTNGEHPRKKSDIIKEKNADYMIEDFPFYAEDTAKEGIETFLINKPRNKDFPHQKYPKIHKVDSRKEIVIT